MIEEQCNWCKEPMATKTKTPLNKVPLHRACKKAQSEVSREIYNLLNRDRYDNRTGR